MKTLHKPQPIYNISNQELKKILTNKLEFFNNQLNYYTNKIKVIYSHIKSNKFNQFQIWQFNHEIQTTYYQIQSIYESINNYKTRLNSLEKEMQKVFDINCDHCKKLLFKSNIEFKTKRFCDECNAAIVLSNFFYLK